MSEAIHIVHGDALELLRGLEANSVDALVTDPPAGISFMGRDWDSDKGGRDQWVAWLRDVMAECHRVLKPGGHALVWALPRTSHWTATAIEDAGFEIRDVVMHLFGTGFPKSLDVSKAIDKAAGAKREVIGTRTDGCGNRAGNMDKEEGFAASRDSTFDITAPATEEARRWAGWGTALKPATEHWILARKPLAGTVAANVLEHGTGAINIDGCRIGTIVETRSGAGGYMMKLRGDKGETEQTGDAPPGRWPAHLTLDEHTAAMLDAQSGIQRSGVAVERNRSGAAKGSYSGGYRALAGPDVGFGDIGGASRFFYVAKPDTTERETFNRHPTVKSIELMRWLCRLITPPGGLVLDPFAGSGTTGLACHLEGFRFLGFEKEAEYVEIARKRIERRPAAQEVLL